MNNEINHLCELKIRHLLRILLIFYKNCSAQVQLNNIHIPHMSIKDARLLLAKSHFAIIDSMNMFSNKFSINKLYNTTLFPISKSQQPS